MNEEIEIRVEIRFLRDKKRVGHIGRSVQRIRVGNEHPEPILARIADAVMSPDGRDKWARHITRHFMRLG